MVELDLLENPHHNHTERVEAMALHFRTIQGPDTQMSQAGQWERDWHTSTIYDTHEHCPKWASRPKLFLCKATWDGLLICYVQADPIAQNLAQTRLRQTLCGRRFRNLTGSHCGAPEIEGSQQRTRHRCHRHPCCKDVNESVSVGSGP